MLRMAVLFFVIALIAGALGLFRTEYEGRTLRENLGLPRPANRFFAEG